MVAKINTHYLKEYDLRRNFLPGNSHAWLRELREAALENFSNTGFPSPRDEEWKYTNVSSIERKLFSAVQRDRDPAGIDPALINDYAIDNALVLVFVDGFYSDELSILRELPSDIIVASMVDALDQHAEKIEACLGSALKNESNGFINFNSALFSDGVFVCISAEKKLEFPVQLLFVARDQDALSTTRNLVIAEQGAQCEIVETYISADDSGYLTASVSEVLVAENACVNWTKVQCESSKGFHFGGLYVNQQAYAQFKHSSFSFGGLLVRNEVHAELGNASECTLDGVFIGAGRQHVDNHTRICHARPNAISREFYKGILDQRARGVFQGRIIVAKDAQKTDSEMNNRNLLLSENAEIDTKPQLEIYADDVKCAHGVTVGRLADESVFYLQSRGIEESAARDMLTFAFANEMVEKITNNNLRGVVQTELLNCLPQSGVKKEWL